MCCRSALRGRRPGRGPAHRASGERTGRRGVAGASIRAARYGRYGLYVPREKLHRFMTHYAPDSETGELRVLDRPDGWWSASPKMPDCGGWLVSTVDDLWAFASMMAADGGDLLA